MIFTYELRGQSKDKYFVLTSFCAYKYYHAFFGLMFWSNEGWQKGMMEIFNLVKPHSPGQASMKSSASSAEISCELVQKKKKEGSFSS